jgi:two-component system response regulator AtoC
LGAVVRGNLLIIEDDAALAEVLTAHFQECGLGARSALTCREALVALATSRPDALLLDQQLPDGTGLDLLLQLREREPDLPVVMMTGAHDLELAIQAIREGAFDFVHKPLDIEELGRAVERALEHARLLRQVQGLRSQVPDPVAVAGHMLGRSKAMLAVSKEIALAAPSNARVLISGESGTGKELVATAIHAHSGRPGPLLAVNCAAIVDNLLESELFGHEKGAFTGAVARKAGKFELASDGTLFLDEVGELAPTLQAKLLRVLQEGVFERVGGTQQLRTTARVVAATNRHLQDEVRNGRFREDLLYRLDVIHIHMPPLRERPEDLAMLVPGLIARIAAGLHRSIPSVSEGALQLLANYDWPGNVRELENVLTQALVRARGPLLAPEHLGALVYNGESESLRAGIGREAEGPPASLEEVEARHVQRVLAYTQGHKAKACEILGISRPALDRKIARHDLELPAGGRRGPRS